jgi:hypothetical protein
VKGARSRYRCDAPIWAATRGGLGRFTTRLMATVGLIVRDAVLRSFLRFPRHAWGLNAAKHDTGTAICCCWTSQCRGSPLYLLGPFPPSRFHPSLRSLWVCGRYLDACLGVESVAPASRSRCYHGPLLRRTDDTAVINAIASLSRHVLARPRRPPAQTAQH